MRVFLVSIVSLLILGAGHADPVRLARSDEPIITMKRIPGWMDWSYEIRVYSDGFVRYRGIRNVAVIGEREGRIRANEVMQLLQSFADAEFSAMSDEYIMKELMDSPILELTLNVPPRAKTVRTQTALSGLSSKLNALGEQIDELVESEQWLKK